MKSSFAIQNVLLLVGLLVSTSVNAFAPSFGVSTRFTTSIYAAAPSDLDPQEIIGTTITVTGDVNGGYLRTCIKNEVSYLPTKSRQGLCYVCTASVKAAKGHINSLYEMPS